MMGTTGTCLETMRPRAWMAPPPEWNGRVVGVLVEVGGDGDGGAAVGVTPRRT